MRLLHLHSGNLYGGIETMLVTTARARVNSASIAFALCFDGRLRQELESAGAECALLGEARFSRPASVRRARLALKALLASNRPDVVALHGPWAQGMFGRTLHRAGVPFVLFVHGPLHGWVQRLGQRWPPAALICNSEHTRAGVPRAYADVPSRVIQYPLAMPPLFTADDRKQVRQILGTAVDDVVIVQASRFEPWKGHATHIRALSRIVDLPGWTLWLIGGAQRPEEATYVAGLKELSRQLGVDNRIRFAGEQADPARFMAAADIYCQPNAGPEPFGLAYVEALAAGLPVVASDLGGVREIVDSTTGRLLRAGDEGALADTLAELIRSAPLRRQLGLAGPPRAAALCDVPRQVSAMNAFIASTVLDVPVR